MTFEEAKQRQMDCFKAGVYLLIVPHSANPSTGYVLVDSPSKEDTEKEMLSHAVAVVKRMPTRLRVIPGGKN